MEIFAGKWLVQVKGDEVVVMACFNYPPEVKNSEFSPEKLSKPNRKPDRRNLSPSFFRGELTVKLRGSIFCFFKISFQMELPLHRPARDFSEPHPSWTLASQREVGSWLHVGELYLQAREDGWENVPSMRISY